MKQIEVVAAIVIRDDKILCLQRDAHKFSYLSYKFEFPGGKVEFGETVEAALYREILEELDLSVEIQKKFLTVDHKYPDFEIILHSFICRALASEFTLKEHISYKWLKPSEIKKLDWAEADLPIVAKLMEEDERVS